MIMHFVMMNATGLRHLFFNFMDLIDFLDHKQVANVRNICFILENNDYFTVIEKTIILVSKIQSTEFIALPERQFPHHD